MANTLLLLNSMGMKKKLYPLHISFVTLAEPSSFPLHISYNLILPKYLPKSMVLFQNSPLFVASDLNMRSGR